MTATLVKTVWRPRQFVSYWLAVLLHLTPALQISHHARCSDSAKTTIVKATLLCKCSLQIISSIKAILDWSGVPGCETDEPRSAKASQDGSRPSSWASVNQSSAATFLTAIPHKLGLQSKLLNASSCLAECSAFKEGTCSPIKPFKSSCIGDHGNYPGRRKYEQWICFLDGRANK